MKNTLITLLVVVLVSLVVAMILNFKDCCKVQLFTDDTLLEGRTSQIFNEDGDYILPQSSGKYFGKSTDRFASMYSLSLDLKDTASTTLHIGSDASTNNSGCIALGDSSATGTVVYITATGATITATTTKPSNCQ